METKIIGNKIAEARKKINISQSQLAEKLFISPQAVGKWERGESFPDIITFNRLAIILGVDLNYFSENFTSLNTIEASVERLPEHAAELATDTPKAKRNWDMSLGNWVDADFSGLKNLNEKFSSSNMKNCKFIGSELSGLLLQANNVVGCDFTGSDISNSQFKSSHVVNTKFNDCLLKNAEFSSSYVKSCNFTGADFSDVVIKSSSFVKNTIENAVFVRTSFNASDIADIVFNSPISDCSFENCEFTKVTFRNSKITNTFFKCRSLKKISFIDCEADRMSYEFLKNGKADMTGIKLVVG